jgi:hypothetical protein
MRYPVVPCVENLLNYLPLDNFLSMQFIEEHATRGHTHTQWTYDNRAVLSKVIGDKHRILHCYNGREFQADLARYALV